MLFAALFATYAVMRNATDGGPGGAALFDLPYVLVETMILLTSSLTAGLVLLARQAQNRKAVLSWLAVTGVLGVAFLVMELHEFWLLVHEGYSWTTNGFLSSYFTLVGTHGLHITVGLFWLLVLFAQIMRKGLTSSSNKRLVLFATFWHFLDVIWIFIFSIVYLWSGRL